MVAMHKCDHEFPEIFNVFSRHFLSDLMHFCVFNAAQLTQIRGEVRQFKDLIQENLSSINLIPEVVLRRTVNTMSNLNIFFMLVLFRPLILCQREHRKDLLTCNNGVSVRHQ